jgi:hypothetical protein
MALPRERFTLPWMAALVCLSALPAGAAQPAGRGGHERGADAKGMAGRLYVWAAEPKEKGKDDGRRPDLGLLSVDPNTGAWARLGGPDMGRDWFVDARAPDGPILRVGQVSPDGRYLLTNQGRRLMPRPLPQPPRTGGTGGLGGGAALEPGGVPRAEPGTWVYDLTGAAPPRQVFDGWGIASWFGSGRRLVIAHMLGTGRFETYRVDVATEARTKLPLPEAELVIDCPADGRWFACLHRDQSVHRVLQGGGCGVLLIPGDVPWAALAISPDGRKVSYSTVIVGPGSTLGEVWVTETDGSREPSRLSFRSSGMLRPCWSPDGSHLAVNVIPVRGSGLGGQPAEDEVVLIDLRGRAVRKLALPSRELVLVGWR